MAKRKRYIKLFDPELVGVSIKQSFVKLNPRLMIKNPVMFTVEIVTAVMLAVCIYQAATGDTIARSFMVQYCCVLHPADHCIVCKFC